MKQLKRKKLPRPFLTVIWGLILLASLYVFFLYASPMLRSYSIPLRLAEKRNLMPHGEVADFVDGEYISLDNVAVELNNELYVYVLYGDYKGDRVTHRKYGSAVFYESSVGSWGCMTVPGRHWDIVNGKSVYRDIRTAYVRCLDAAAVQGQAELTLSRNAEAGPTVVSGSAVERLNASFFKLTFSCHAVPTAAKDPLTEDRLMLYCYDEAGNLLHTHEINITEGTEEIRNGT